MPNLRYLNLNSNALQDLQPLLGIARLEKLYLVGNRLSRLRRTAAVLSRIAKELTELDLRANPLTVGFYAFTAIAASGDRSLVVKDKHARMKDPGDDDDEESDPGAKLYILPPANRNSDIKTRERLDGDTKLRRRVYEMLVVGRCKRLKWLDGLQVDRKATGAKDGVWERLVEVGVLRGREGE